MASSCTPTEPIVQLSEDRQASIDFLAKELNDCTIGNTCISMDWGNAQVECFDRGLKDLLRDLARDYTRLRAIVKQMPPEQFARYERKINK